ITGAIVATSIVFFPAAPLFLLVHGKDITIPKGTEITAYINGDIPLDPKKFVTQTAVSPEAGATRSSPPLIRLRSRMGMAWTPRSRQWTSNRFLTEPRSQWTTSSWAAPPRHCDLQWATTRLSLESQASKLGKEP